MTGLMSVPLLLILSAGLINYGSCIGYLHPGETDRSKGTFLGYFTTYAHNVTGAVFALDEEWLHVENFYYDGIGPDAFFWVGTEGDQPSPQGFLVPFPPNSSRGEVTRLPSFTYQNVLLRLPSRLKVSDLRWISVWCRRFTVNFGSMKVPSNVVLPQKRKLSEMSRLAHGVRSGNVTLLDAKTVYIPNLHYDGAAPDAYFWVGKGIPDRTGRKIPNEKKSLEVLGHYDGVDIELVLPDNLTLYDIDYLSIWCVAYRHDFGHVLIPPPSQMYLPPALGQTQVKESGSELQPVETKPEDRYSTTPQVENTTDLPTEDILDSTVTVSFEYTTTDLYPTTSDPMIRSAEETTYFNVDENITSTTEIDSSTMTEFTTENIPTTTMLADIINSTLASNDTVDTSDYFATPVESENGTFKYGRAIQYDFLNVSMNEVKNNDTQLFLKEYKSSDGTSMTMLEFGGPVDISLSEGLNTFRYESQPEVEKVTHAEITEVIVYHNDTRNNYSVGNAEAVQDVVDLLENQIESDNATVVEVELKSHFGAFILADNYNDSIVEEGNMIDNDTDNTHDPFTPIIVLDDVVDTSDYFATPVASDNNTFKYGEAAQHDFFNVSMNEVESNDTQLFLKEYKSSDGTSMTMLEFRGPVDISLSEGLNTFRYETEPEEEQVTDAEITEVIIYHNDTQYNFTVGNAEAVQKMVDLVKNETDNATVIQIDSKKHFGAYIMPDTSNNSVRTDEDTNMTEVTERVVESVKVANEAEPHDNKPVVATVESSSGKKIRGQLRASSAATRHANTINSVLTAACIIISLIKY